jgi:hypothetical protein
VTPPLRNALTRPCLPEIARSWSGQTRMRAWRTSAPIKLTEGVTQAQASSRLDDRDDEQRGRVGSCMSRNHPDSRSHADRGDLLLASEWGEVLLALFDAIADRHDDLTLADVVTRARAVGLSGDELWWHRIGPLVDELESRLLTDGAGGVVRSTSALP